MAEEGGEGGLLGRRKRVAVTMSFGENQITIQGLLGFDIYPLKMNTVHHGSPKNHPIERERNLPNFHSLVSCTLPLAVLEKVRPSKCSFNLNSTVKIGKYLQVKTGVFGYPSLQLGMTCQMLIVCCQIWPFVLCRVFKLLLSQKLKCHQKNV